jgi:hypothetical protein
MLSPKVQDLPGADAVAEGHGGMVSVFYGVDDGRQPGSTRPRRGGEMTYCIEYRRRQNGQMLNKVTFHQRTVWEKVVDYIVNTHGLEELDNNKRDERRWWNGNGVIMAAYQKHGISSHLAIKEAKRLFG